MTHKLWTFDKDVSGNSEEQLNNVDEGKSLSPEAGTTLDIEEIDINSGGSATLRIFIEGERLTTVKTDEITQFTLPIPVNWTVTEGQEMRIKAEDTSGSSNDVAITIKADEASS